MKHKFLLVLIFIVIIVMLIFTITVYADQQTNYNDTENKIIEKASKSMYDERNAEFVKKQLDILKENSSQETKNRKLSELKQEMQAYGDELQKQEIAFCEENISSDLNYDSLKSKIENLEYTFSLLKMVGTESDKARFSELQNKATKLLEDLEKDSSNLAEISNQYQILNDY